MDIKKSNLEIIKANFHYHELKNIDEESIAELILELDEPVNTEDITFTKSWKKFKTYFVYIKEKPLFFIKQVWEYGVIKELIALHIAKYFLDPELFASNYIFGLQYPDGLFKKSPIPFLLNTIVKGEAITKKSCENYAFQLGRHYYVHQILSLYDCELRHFLADRNNLKRIDLGLAFYHLDHKYRGFEEYMPNYLPYLQNFWRGFQFEKGKIDVMLLNTRDDLKQLLREIQKFRRDDLVNFDGPEFVGEIFQYWERERIPVLKQFENKQNNNDF